jgi:hypothetical protein
MEFIMPKGTVRATADTLVSSLSQLINVDGSAARAAGSATYRNEYISTIQVISFHETGVPNARYTFEEAFPVSVAPTPLNWGDDGIQRVTVTFKYTTWSREKNILKQIYDLFTPGGTVSVQDLPLIDQ